MFIQQPKKSLLCDLRKIVRRTALFFALLLSQNLFPRPKMSSVSIMTASQMVIAVSPLQVFPSKSKKLIQDRMLNSISFLINPTTRWKFVFGLLIFWFTPLFYLLIPLANWFTFEVWFNYPVFWSSLFKFCSQSRKETVEKQVQNPSE